MYCIIISLNFLTLYKKLNLSIIHVFSINFTDVDKLYEFLKFCLLSIIIDYLDQYYIVYYFSSCLMNINFFNHVCMFYLMVDNDKR